MKNKNWKLFFTIWTILFTIISFVNLGDILFFHTPIFDGISWEQKSSENLFINKIIKNTSADRSNLEENDILISIDDKTFKNIREIYNYVHKKKPGDVSTYKFLRGEQEITTNLTFEPFGLMFAIISSIVGLLFLLVGYIVVLKKPNSYIPRLFYYFCFTFFLIIGFNSTTNTQPLGTIFKFLQIFGYMIWAPVILHFFLNFPLRAPILNKHPKIIYLIYLPSILITTYVLFFNTKLEIFLTISIIIYITFAFNNLFHSRAKITNPHELKSLRIIIWGMFLGLVPLGILAILSKIVVGQFGITPVGVVFAFTAFVPIAFGYSIMRYGLMDVEIIVKKSLLYTAFTTSFILLYFLLVIGLGGFIVRQFGISSELANLIFLALVALVFQPIRNGIQMVIDRHFYRDRYQYQKTLLQLSQDLQGLLNVNDISKRVTETISEAMHVRTVLIDLYVDKSESYKNQYAIGIDPNINFCWYDEPNSLIHIIKKEKNCCLFYKIEEDERYHNLPLNDKVKIEKMGIVLSVPMFYQDSLIGMISLGQKQSGQVYNQEDMDLLQTLAGNTAVAMVNSKLHQEDLRKQQFENELLFAKSIQTKLLPEKDPEYPNFEIVGFSKPATIVGGDYYDYIPISTNKIYIFIGDVSGKGMPAALYMSKVQGMMQVAAGIYKTPQKLLSVINQNLYKKMDRKFFVTMCGTMVDVSQKKLTICRAGHTPVYIKRKDKLEKYVGNGIGLGLEAGEIFNKEIEEKQFKLKSGEYCLFFSDGLIDAENADHEMFGEERLEQILAKGNFNSAEELKEEIFKEVKTFRKNEPQNDDITIVVLKAE